MNKSESNNKYESGSKYCSGNKSDSGAGVFELIIGFALIVVGLILLLLNISVTNFGFYRFGTVSSGPILVIVLIFLIVWAVARKRKIALILCGVDILMIVVSVLLGTRFVFKHISVFTLIVMIGMFAVGVGLVLKNIFLLTKKKDKDN